MCARQPGPSFAAAMRSARGQTSIEYAGVLALVALLFAAPTRGSHEGT